MNGYSRNGLYYVDGSLLVVGRSFGLGWELEIAVASLKPAVTFLYCESLFHFFTFRHLPRSRLSAYRVGPRSFGRWVWVRERQGLLARQEHLGHFVGRRRLAPLPFLLLF